MSQPPNPNDPTTPSHQPYSQDPPQQPYYPPPPVTQPPRKRRTWLWVVLGVLALLVLGCVGVVALASRSVQTSTTNPGTAPGNTPLATTPAPSSQLPSVGGTITVNDVAVTLTSVKKLAGDEFVKPKAGNMFIVVHVKIVNNSASEVDYNAFDFHARSGSGNITDAEITPSTYTANNQLNFGKLSAGGTVEGDIIFQVKKGDHGSELTWQPNFLGNAGDNAWNLGL